jgi:hypothetical protein
VKGAQAAQGVQANWEQADNFVDEYAAKSNTKQSARNLTQAK